MICLHEHELNTIQLEDAAQELSQRGLAVARNCAKNLASLTLKSLNQALDAVFSAKCVRDFAKNQCPELRFALRQLTGLICTVSYMMSFFFLLESVRQEKDQREERAKQEEDDKYKVVSKTFF